MTAGEVRQSVDAEVIRLGDISPSSLADQLDDQGVVRIRGAVSTEWLDALRASVTDYIAGHGDGDFIISEAGREIGSPAHQLVSDPALRQLFSETARLRWPETSSAQGIRSVIPVRPGSEPKSRSNLFHYDASVLTMIVPVFIPQAAIGNSGELAAFGNKRPFRRFAASHLVDTLLTHNSLYRRHFAKTVLDAPEKYIVPLQPGDAYIFWGYRTLHGNFACGPGLLRATLVLQYGELHSGSRAMNVVWRFSRSRRDMRRFQYLPVAASTS